MNEEKYYSPKNVAARFDVSPSVVNRWLNTGQLQGFKVGNMWRIRERDIEEFITKSTGR